VNALELFRAGHDTIEIAHVMRISEAEAYNLVSREREEIHQRERRERAYQRKLERDRAYHQERKVARSRNEHGQILYAGAE
jgi:hypothetical protein